MGAEFAFLSKIKQSDAERAISAGSTIKLRLARRLKDFKENLFTSRTESRKDFG
jgi:hypothetical protein